MATAICCHFYYDPLVSLFYLLWYNCSNMKHFITINSSNIKEVKWQAQLLTVTFHDGLIYEYRNVPESVFDQLESQKNSNLSVGKAFEILVKQQGYSYQRIK